MNSRTEKVIDECLLEMFARVGLKFTEIKEVNEWAKAQGDEWYRKKLWTDDEQESFRDWMVLHLRKRMRWTLARSDKEVSWYLLMWGWSHKKEVEETQ